ncbi:MAG: hypothetical protein ACI9SC_002498 [Gammaproteobacteria bacterium]
MTILVDEWIEKFVQGGSFADIGGLFRTYGEKVTCAHKFGATKLTMVDVQGQSNKMWTAFQTHALKHGVDQCESITANATNNQFVKKVGKHDFVHCAGLIYHVPDPIGLLLNLKAITNKYLIIKSVVVPESIRTKSGQLELSNGPLFIPTLNEKQRQILVEYFNKIDMKVHGINGKEIPSWLGENGKPRTGPWWWLWTPELLGQLLKTVEIEIIEEGFINPPRSYAFLCKPKGK